MATITLTRGKTLGDTGVKADLHDLIDMTTASIASIANADISATAAIAGTKVTPNFGAQNISTTGNVTISGTANFGDDIKLSGSSLNAASGLVTLDANSIVNGKRLGANASKNVDTVYQAATDGEVEVWIQFSSSQTAYIAGLTDSSNPPTTVVQKTGNNGAVYDATNSFDCFSFSVRKNDYYKVLKSGTVTSTNIIFIPSGT